MAANGGGLLLDGGVGVPVLLDVAPESPPQAPSIKTDAAPAHRKRRIAGYLANMRTQLRVAGLEPVAVFLLVSAPESV